MFSSSWLEVALAGFATALFANRVLNDEPGRAAAAFVEPSREAILHRTCVGSDTAWARLIRAGLRSCVDEGEAGYRDAPTRRSAVVTRVHSSERSRLRRLQAIGSAGVLAMFVGSLFLLEAQSGLMGLLIVAALLCGWRIQVNAYRAQRALARTAEALPDLMARLPAPPALAAQPIEVGVQTKVGCIGWFFVCGLGLSVVLLLGGIGYETSHPVTAKQIGVLFTAHVFVLLLLLIPVMFLQRVTAELTATDVVCTHRLFGLTYARTIAPLEIVRRFYFERARRGVNTLAIETPNGNVTLARGDDAEAAAAKLNEALGRRGPVTSSRAGEGARATR